MNANKQSNENKSDKTVISDEQKIRLTVKKSLEAFYAAEEKKILSYHEFLWTQLKVIEKKWWLFQFLLLFCLWFILKNAEDDFYIQRSLGVIASLFVILVIPEFWKNSSNKSMEIEAVSYFSLKQVYAARTLLFGIADTLLLTVFCGAATAGLHFELLQLMVQFLLPLSVTACICFGTLCSKYSFSEGSAIILCVLWSAIWLFIVLNENIYEKIAVPVWILLIGFAAIYMFLAIYRLLNHCNHYLEVLQNGSEI